MKDELVHTDKFGNTVHRKLKSDGMYQYYVMNAKGDIVNKKESYDMLKGLGIIKGPPIQKKKDKVGYNYANFEAANTKQSMRGYSFDEALGLR